MGKTKTTKKFALVKRMINPNDASLKVNQEKLKKKEEEKEKVVRHMILVDTSFINFSIQNKIELVKGMIGCLYAKSFPCITDCVMAELEKLGPKFKVALRVARDPRYERLPCTHKGTYADDC
ncbi:MAG: Fcf1-domain-containing protein [Linnemannia gamsii]|nr:MAG: Fcf1-domain-containing protein [Linnemannia gamsii]